MKKLLSLILCVALLTGVCAAAFAEKDEAVFFDSDEKSEVLRTVVKCYDDIRNLAYTGVLLEHERLKALIATLQPMKEAIDSLEPSVKQLKEILSKQDIGREDFAAGLRTAKDLIAIKPVVDKFRLETISEISPESGAFFLALIAHFMTAQIWYPEMQRMINYIGKISDKLGGLNTYIASVINR